MRIKVILDKDNYIEQYAEFGEIPNNIEILVPNNLIVREESYNMVWNGNNFEKGDLINAYERLSEEFKNNHSYYKYDNNLLIYDENKKIMEENAKLEEKKEYIRQQIVTINLQITEYEKEGFDITDLLIKKQELKNELESL